MHDELRPTGALRTGAALACFGIGTIGLLLPLVPGIPFLIAGAWLMRRRNAVRAPLTSALSRADPTPLERLQIGGLLAARRLTMAAERWHARRRQRPY